jgi:hypothetical protein
MCVYDANYVCETLAGLFDFCGVMFVAFNVVVKYLFEALVKNGVLK